MRKILIYTLLTIILAITAYFTFLYYATYSEGVRAGELIRFSHKGVVFKTWEGEMSQGISGAQIFSFSILENEKETINSLLAMQGQYVKVKYVERYKTFPWWGESRFFITNVEKEVSPFNVK